MIILKDRKKEANEQRNKETNKERNKDIRKTEKIFEKEAYYIFFL
jgi:hypothetical protein